MNIFENMSGEEGGRSDEIQENDKKTEFCEKRNDVGTETEKRLESVRNMLEEHGFEAKDIKSSLALMVAINFFDRIVFGNNCADFSFVPKDDINTEHFAGFVSSSNERKKPSYLIKPKGFDNWVRMERQKGKRIYYTDKKGDGNYHFEKNISPDLFLLRVAAHEVRHRLVDESLAGMFSVNDLLRIKDEVLKEIIIYEDYQFEKMRKIYCEEGKPEEYINKELSPREFDAKVIERLALSKLWEMLCANSGVMENRDYKKIGEEISAIIKLNSFSQMYDNA